MRQAGIGPNRNVFAEIGSTWWYTFRYPTQAAHVLGKLLNLRAKSDQEHALAGHSGQAVEHQAPDG